MDRMQPAHPAGFEPVASAIGGAPMSSLAVKVEIKDVWAAGSTNQVRTATSITSLDQADQSGHGRRVDISPG